MKNKIKARVVDENIVILHGGKKENENKNRRTAGEKKQ